MQGKFLPLVNFQGKTDSVRDSVEFLRVLRPVVLLDSGVSADSFTLLSAV